MSEAWQPCRRIQLKVLTAQAANAGGVAVSGLEMSQNSMRLTWTSEEVDQKLKVPVNLWAPTL